MYRKLLAIVIALYLVPSQAQNATPDAGRVTQFQTDPVAENARSNASAISNSCPTVSATASVNDRYDQAVARRKCLESAQLIFATTAAAPPSPSPDPNVRALDTAAKDAASAELLKTMKETENAKAEEEKAGAAKSFMGSNWAVGIGYSFGQGPKRISEAEVVNGVVRVKQDDTDKPIVLLEVHRLFESKRFRGFGWGPFASIQTGSDDAVLGFGAGLQFGWRDPEPKSSGGFLLGVGYGWTQGVKTLGDGIVADQALPDGETEIRYKTRSAESIFVFVSRRFDLGPVKD